MQAISPGKNLDAQSFLIFQSFIEMIKAKSLDQHLSQEDQVIGKHVDIKFTFKDKPLNDMSDKVHDDLSSMNIDLP